jgi:hypothetical protein
LKVKTTLRAPKEPALGYLAIAVAILLVGPGKLALDALIFGRRKLTDRVRQ